MKTKHFPLIVGLALPVVFIIIISVVIFTPSLFVKPQHNFIYTTDSNYYRYNESYKNNYVIKNSRITLEPIPSQQNITQTKEAPTLYMYDVKENTARQITLEDAQKYSVAPGPSSPDGYSVEYEYGHSGIFELFGSNGDDRGYFISKGNGKKKINGVEVDGYMSPSNFNLIGWVK